MDFYVRQAAIEDLEAIVSLWCELMEDQMGRDPYFDKPLDFSGGNTQFTAALKDPNCCIFVAIMEEKIIGFIEVWLYKKDFYFFVDDYAYIMHFIITKDARKDRKIYALNHKLYRAAEAWAISKGSKYLAADVFGYNEVVLKLLNRAGMDIYRMRLTKKLDGENGDKE